MTKTDISLLIFTVLSLGGMLVFIKKKQSQVPSSGQADRSVSKEGVSP